MKYLFTFSEEGIVWNVCFLWEKKTREKRE